MKMIKGTLAAAIVVAGMATVGAANAQIASATFTANASNSSPSPAPTTGYTLVQSFDSCSLGANGACGGMSGNYHILNGNQSGTGTIPFGGDTTNYLSVFASDANPAATYTFTTPATSIQFDWGSAASTDTLTIFTKTGASTSSYVYTVPNSSSAGSNGSGTYNYNLNGLFTATATAGTVITGLQFAATQNSFEVENIAVGTPEPATWGMMILGFGMVGGLMRRRSATKTTVRFA